MQFQRQAVRVLEKGHPLACKFIHPHRLCLNALFPQLRDGGIHIIHPERQMSQAAGFGITWPGRIAAG